MKYQSVKKFKIIPEGAIIEPDKNDKYIYSIESDGIITSMELTSDMLRDKEFFKPHKYIEVTVREEDLDNSNEKNWKVVFNLKCTEKKLLEIRNFIEQNVNEIL